MDLRVLYILAFLTVLGLELIPVVVELQMPLPTPQTHARSTLCLHTNHSQLSSTGPN